MRICRFKHPSKAAPCYGVLEEDYVLPLVDDIFAPNPQTSSDQIPLSEIRILAPVEPSKIVCVGRNYLEHAAELGNAMPNEPLLFLKAPSSLIGTVDTIWLPPESTQVEHEGELGVVIGRRASRLTDADDPFEYILGYTCVNDVTARDLQRKDVQFTRAKSFDTFCPTGPFILRDPLQEHFLVSARVNGETKQQASTSAMAFSVSHLIRYVSRAMTLNPGDLIATGTPAGVSRLKDGDIVEIEIDGIGTLRNEVRGL
jgi:2-keto-4-pentenoate hydratase/2-oxohepta-3-ene-1,7-dioic acid hydratase in catechol pathway